MQIWDKIIIFVPKIKIIMEIKICRECKRELPIDQFELEHTKNGDRRRGTCRECRAKYRKKWREKNPDLYRAQVARHQDR